MFGLLKRKKPFENSARDVYDALHTQSRKEFFYTDLNISDTTEGRFAVLVLHNFMLMHLLNDDEEGAIFSQSLFDIMFEDIDRGYRDIGVGDMGVPKRMKKLMLAYNGSMHAYEQTINDETKFKDALLRNVYTDHLEPQTLDGTLNRLYDYVRKNIEYLEKQGKGAIIKGKIDFKEFKQKKI